MPFKSTSIVFFLLFWITVRSQNTALNKIDRNLTASYKNMMSTDVGIRCDSFNFLAV
jgi:hypothetical protein